MGARGSVARRGEAARFRVGRAARAASSGRADGRRAASTPGRGLQRGLPGSSLRSEPVPATDVGFTAGRQTTRAKRGRVAAWAACGGGIPCRAGETGRQVTPRCRWREELSPARGWGARGPDAAAELPWTRKACAPCWRGRTGARTRSGVGASPGLTSSPRSRPGNDPRVAVSPRTAEASQNGSVLHVPQAAPSAASSALPRSLPSHSPTATSAPPRRTRPSRVFYVRARSRGRRSSRARRRARGA
jgi:hypothetical protein